MNWIKKAKAAAAVFAAIAALGIMTPEAEAYTYSSEQLGIEVEMAAQPARMKTSGNAAQMLYEDHMIVMQVMPNQQTKADYEAYLTKSNTEIKQQMSAYQKDMGVILVDTYWVEGGNNPIQFAEAYDKQKYMVTATVLSEKTICTILRLASNKITDADRDAFIASAKTLAFKN